MNQRLVGATCLAGSLIVHGWLIKQGSHRAPQHVLPAQPSFVQLSMAPLPEAIREAEPEPAPKLDPPVKAPPKPVERAPEPLSEQPAQNPEPVTEAPPPELTGTTLVSALGEEWSAPEGSGTSRNGAISAGVSRPVQASAPTRPMPRPPEPPAAVPLAQLSKKPVAPPLGDALERNYPPEARSQGRAGEAKVRARIEPSGAVASASIAFESAAGFGHACRKTLIQSKWSAPLNDQGQPVATWITYRCKFRIDD